MLFKADNLGALIEAISGLIGRPDFQKTLCENGLAFVRNERNWTNSVANYVQVYGGACQEIGGEDA